MSRRSTTTEPSSTPNGRETPDWRWLLALWMAVVIVLNGVIWTTGVTDYGLAQAVENGAAQVEKQQIGEESEDVIRKAIQLQRDTLDFWTVIAAIHDFLIAPVSLGLRAFAVAVALSAVAATTGRPVRFPQALYECVTWQGVWVLALVVQVILMMVLQRSTISTSILMFLSQDSYTARQWTLLQQIDCFALVGWLGMAWAARGRQQANLLAALVVCLVLAAIEIYICYGASLVVNLSMRMTLMSP